MKGKIIISIIAVVAIIGVVIFSGDSKSTQTLPGVKKDVFVQVRFKAETPVGRYTDNILYTEEQYAKATTKDIDAEITKRIDKWVSTIQNPAPVAEPVTETPSDAN